MKNTVKITSCGVISALATVLLLGTNIPIFLYTVPALVGILFMVPAIEFSAKWAFLCYLITSVIGVILPTEREALVMFIGIFGYYPILKMLLERLPNKALSYSLKFIIFNVAVIGCYYVIVNVLGINAFESDNLSVTVVKIALLIAGNIAFQIFDFALTRLIRAYFYKFRKPVRRALGLKGKY